MGAKTLVALDTDHIKQFVFATNKLKEIRGASALLDHLNRRTMKNIAGEHKADQVYANGGGGLFLVEGDEEQARRFGEAIQQAYLEKTHGGATVSFATQPIPEEIENIWQSEKLLPYMRLLYYRLAQQAACPHQESEVLPSHPFMRPCDACGVRYAEDRYRGDRDDADNGGRRDSADLDEQERRYCKVCLAKREEDDRVRKRIQEIIQQEESVKQVSESSEDAEDIEDTEDPQDPESQKRSYTWQNIIKQLREASYHIAPDTDRPTDFNKLQGISGGKDYMALIYADANGMGTAMYDVKTLEARKATAEMVDEAIYTAMSTAIVKHLPVDADRDTGKPMFPFDILMIGGDDVMVVTPADVAVDVALTLANVFREKTRESRTLSIAIILAPVKYPFGLLHELAESTLKHAKKEGAKRDLESQESTRPPVQDGTMMNFVVVAGNTGQDFKKVKDALTRKYENESTRFYATLRPFGVEEMKELREAILEGKQKDLGRTKLHQLREAVMKKNRTTSVSDALAILNNWKDLQRRFVYTYVLQVATRYQQQWRKEEDPGSWFPHVTFPWFEDGKGVYRSPLLDFVELYDFIEEKGGNSEA